MTAKSCLCLLPLSSPFADGFCLELQPRGNLGGHWGEAWEAWLTASPCRRFWKGLLAVWLGGGVGQSLAFLLARYLVGDWVSTLVRGKSKKWDVARPSSNPAHVPL